MSDGVLSQEEINALLSGGIPDADTSDAAAGEELTPDEVDTIGEIANISMGTAATTLFSLVNKKVEISTPVVSMGTWDEIVDKYEKPCVLVRIAYTKGLDGSNILVLRENDVKIITDLMMGGDGSNTDGEITELHLSAISEAMNQMMGSSATSMSSMLNTMIDISPPSSTLMDLQDTTDGGEIEDFLEGRFVKITFKMLIGDLVDSEIMQLYPVSLAKEMCSNIMSNMESDTASTVDDDMPTPQPEPASQPQAAPQTPPQAQGQMQEQAMLGQTPPPQPMPDMGTRTAIYATAIYATAIYAATISTTTAGQCAACTIPTFCRQLSGTIPAGKYRSYHGRSIGSDCRVRQDTQIHSGYFGFCTGNDHRIKQDRRRTNRRIGQW